MTTYNWFEMSIDDSYNHHIRLCLKTLKFMYADNKEKAVSLN